MGTGTSKNQGSGKNGAFFPSFLPSYVKTRAMAANLT
jgi:hypothetical protein